MFYPSLKFKGPKNRPFFYTNFVSTLDGKVAVRNKGYWPIGSKKDFEVLLELRAHADVLVHGKNTALSFRHMERLAEPRFKTLRRKIGKESSLLYMVVSDHPDDQLARHLKSISGAKAVLVTSEAAHLSKKLRETVDVMRFGERHVDIDLFAEYLWAAGKKHVLVEGGPSLVGSFFARDLIDEVFLTIAPKVFGSKPGDTATMMEGSLLSPAQSRRFELLSAKKLGDEMFLRYRTKR